jgi:hypothetical protein
MNGPDVFRGHDYSKLQMSGMHLRKVVRALIRLRRERGTLAGSAAALTMVTVDIAAAITGARLSERVVENMCVSLDFRPDKTVIARLTQKAVREMSSGAFAIMPSKLIGKLLDFTAEEKWTIAGRLKLERIWIEPIDHQADVLRRKRESEAKRRASSGAKPRSESDAAVARRLEISRSTLARRKARDADSWKLPMGRETASKSDPSSEAVSWMHPGECDTFVDATLLQGKSHESASSLPVPVTNPVPEPAQRKRTKS